MDEDSTQKTSPPPEDVSGQSQSLHVDDLPDDVLLTVFERLDIKSRVRIERVSQRWQQLARQLWKSQRHLSLVGVFSSRPELPGRFCSAPLCPAGLTPCVLEALLVRCDGCVRTLNLGFATRSLNSEAGAVISVLCPNLENIDISGARLNNTSVQLLAEGCSKLKTAVLMRCTEVDDGGIRKLLGLCKNLELLNLAAMHRLSGECFSEAGTGLRRLLLDGCWGLTMAGLSAIVTKCTSLVELSLSRCIQATDRELELLGQNLTALKIFRFSGSFPGCTSASIISIANLSLLEDLDLSHNRHVTEVAISTICKGCKKLRCLDLTGIHNHAGDAILAALAACSSLRILKVSYAGVTDVGLNAIAHQGQLRSFEVRGCPTVTNEGVQALVKQCSHLHMLDLTGCRLLDNRAVTECNNIVRERPHVLTMAVGDTRVRASRLNLDPKCNLKLDTRNMSADYSEADGWDHMLFYDDRLYDLDYWDEDYEDYEGVDDDVWDLELDGEDPVAELAAEAALAAEEALAGGVLPADLPPGMGGGIEEWAPPGYLQDMLDMPPSDDDDWPYDYYDDYGYGYDGPLSDDEGWVQGYYDFDDPHEDDEEDFLDQGGDLGIGGLFHEPREDGGGAPGGAGVADIDHPPANAAGVVHDWGPDIAYVPGNPQVGGNGGARPEDGLEIADLLDDPQEEEQDGYQGGVEIADYLDDPQEEPWTPEGSDYGDYLDDPQEVQW